MAKKIAVLVEQISEDEFTIWTNADEPTKSVNDHCALHSRNISPGWQIGIVKWLEQNGYCIHPDSDFSPGQPFLSFDDDYELRAFGAADM
jgi:hypothetical protein